MSTLTDLFNISIGTSKRAVFAEKSAHGWRILLSQEKLPVKENLRVRSNGEIQVDEMLTEADIAKESVYYVLSPHQYYRNRVILPFNERAKIEGVIKYEVKEYLPSPEEDYLTDFYNIDNEIFTFSTDKERVRDFLQELGPYRENLKAIVPYDVALLYGMVALTDERTYVLLDIHSDALYIQWVENLRIRTGIYLRENTNGAGGAPSEEFRKNLLSELIMIFKASNCSFVYLNVRTGGEEVMGITESSLNDMGMSYQEVPLFKYAKYLTQETEAEPADTLTLYGLLQEVNQPPLQRVNLLKEEFKPRPKGYVSVKEFTIVGILLFILLFISTAGLTIDIRFRKNQVAVLKERIAQLNQSAFGEPAVSIEEARKNVADIQERIQVFEESTDRRFSGLWLLKELSFYIPQDVIIEYSDIIIERERIKFSGKARTFSDIDKIRQELLQSDYFSDVRISNTGTTGSTGGFTVTFVFDIDVVEELSIGD